MLSFRYNERYSSLKNLDLAEQSEEKGFGKAEVFFIFQADKLDLDKKAPPFGKRSGAF